MGLAHARPSRVRHDAWRRGDHRAARPGRRQRRRHGHRGAAPGRGVQPARPRHRGSLDLRDLLRRRPPGGDRVGGGQPRRPPQARQAARALRRQPDPARRPDRDGLLGGRPRALPGLRLADSPGQGRHRRGGDRRCHPAGSLRRPAFDHRRPDGDRPGLAEQGGQPEGPRRRARSGRGAPHEGGLRVGPRPHASTCRTPWPPSSRGRSSSARSSRAAGTQPSSATGRPTRRRPASSSAASTATSPPGWDATLPRWEAGAEVATRNASADTINALAAGRPGALRRLGRPLREQPHRRQGRRRLHPDSCRPQPALRRPRARHGRDRERDRVATAVSGRTSRRSSPSPTTCAAASASRPSPGSR